MTERRVHLVVTGDVQGVGFRWFARERANEHGMAGWVKNRLDGSVEATVSGDPPRVEAFLESLKRGPSRSRVEDLQIRDEETGEELPYPFEIRR